MKPVEDGPKVLLPPVDAILLHLRTLHQPIRAEGGVGLRLSYVLAKSLEVRATRILQAVAHYALFQCEARVQNSMGAKNKEM